MNNGVVDQFTHLIAFWAINRNFPRLPSTSLSSHLGVTDCGLWAHATR
nr:MAG TPA: hypothetical protein [Caudoviricetes sp.]